MLQCRVPAAVTAVVPGVGRTRAEVAEVGHQLGISIVAADLMLAVWGGKTYQFTIPEWLDGAVATPIITAVKASGQVVTMRYPLYRLVVLAAAIVGQDNVIVTHNLRDFPDAALAPYNIRAMHPDRFIRHLIDVAPTAVVEVVRDQQISLRNPPVAMQDLLALFERIGLIETVAELRRLIGI